MRSEKAFINFLNFFMSFEYFVVEHVDVFPRMRREFRGLYVGQDETRHVAMQCRRHIRSPNTKTLTIEETRQEPMAN